MTCIFSLYIIDGRVRVNEIQYVTTESLSATAYRAITALDRTWHTCRHTVSSHNTGLGK